MPVRHENLVFPRNVASADELAFDAGGFADVDAGAAKGQNQAGDDCQIYSLASLMGALFISSLPGGFQAFVSSSCACSSRVARVERSTTWRTPTNRGIESRARSKRGAFERVCPVQAWQSQWSTWL
jgi:hypothetical protein